MAKYEISNFQFQTQLFNILIQFSMLLLLFYLNTHYILYNMESVNETYSFDPVCVQDLQNLLENIKISLSKSSSKELRPSLNGFTK